MATVATTPSPLMARDNAMDDGRGTKRTHVLKCQIRMRSRVSH